MLYTFNNNEEIVRLFIKVFNKEILLLEPLDRVTDQYYDRKLDRYNYNKALEEARKRFLKYVEVILKKDRNIDTEWKVMLKLPLQLVSML